MSWDGRPVVHENRRIRAKVAGKRKVESIIIIVRDRWLRARADRAGVVIVVAVVRDDMDGLAVQERQLESEGRDKLRRREMANAEPCGIVLSKPEPIRGTVPHRRRSWANRIDIGDELEEAIRRVRSRGCKR